MPVDPSSSPSDDTPRHEKELESLYTGLESADLRPLWMITEQLLTPQPRPQSIPWLWRASTMRPLAEEAIRLVPVERGGERRVLSLANPGLGGRPYAAGTLWGALQCLGPRESAPAHRHTPGAIRFVLEGEGVWTTVDGDACDMYPGDLVLTPGNAWHDHTNGGDGNMFWFDGLDLPIVEALDAVFFEAHPDFRQPTSGPHNRSETEYRAGGGRGGFTPDAVQSALDPEPSPLLVYRWADTDRRLAEVLEDGKGPLATVEFTNPRSGASVLPTLSCFAHRLAAGGGSSLPTRRSGNTVFVVFRGEGVSIIDGQRFDWGEGDMFVVPSWSAVEHSSASGADLFTLSDTPVLRALGIYREEVLVEPQVVTKVFE